MISNTNIWLRICYTAWSPVYNRLVAPFNAKRRRSLELANPQPGERVLIVGAGTGLDLDHLPPGLSVSAIDLTPAMIFRLRRRAGRLGLAVDARVMNAQALDFPDASFDLVILHLILAVLPDPVRCLQEVQRVLRPGGRAVILDKFVKEQGTPPLGLRLLNPLMSLFGTQLTRRLPPILAATNLRVIHDEPATKSGYFRIVLLEK